MSCSCCAVVHPSSVAPMTEGSSTAGIRPPDYLSPPQIFFPAAGSHENCITIINRADDLEDYTGPQERSHSFVSAYIMQCLILHATLSSCSPIRLWVSSKLMVKLEFLNGCGVHIGSAINSIYLLSGSSPVSTMRFMLGGKQTVKKPLSIFFNWSHYLHAIIGFGSIHRLLPSLWISACTPYIISLCFIPMHESYCKQWN